MDKQLELNRIESQMQNCHDCPLGQTRTKLVYGSGDPNSPIMLIGEAPGKNEDLQGYPFVGRAGQLLDSALTGLGLTHDQVYIANVLKCRPPNNRDPHPDEVIACTPHLNRQINIIRPKVIVALGAWASRFCLNANPNTPMHAMRGKPVDKGGYFILPVYHPAACIYDQAKLPVLQQDLSLIKSLLLNSQ